MSKTLIIFLLFAGTCFGALAQSGKETVPDSVMQSIYDTIKTPYKYGLVVVPPGDSKQVDCPSVFRKDNSWYMTYILYNGRGYETWLAKSKDLLHWNTLGRILSFSDTTDWDNNQKAGYVALEDYKWGGDYKLNRYKDKYWMSYFGGSSRGYEKGVLSIGIAYTGGNPTKPHEWKRLDHPVLSIHDKDVSWWDNHTLYKSTVIWDKSEKTGHPFVMYYNANGDSVDQKRGAERIGMAVSDDMVHWQRYGKDPVLDHHTGITGDPYIQKIGNIYVMFYFGAFWPHTSGAFNRFACSYDLVHWTDWKGPNLIEPSETYDEVFAHKSFVVKYKGTVYHFYCAVNKPFQRGIAVATSKDLGKSTLHFSPTSSKVQHPVIKVDLDQAGRPEKETNALGYQPWVIKNATSDSKTFDGIKVQFSSIGKEGTTLKTDWYKTGIRSSERGKLVCDGITVDGGKSGGQIEMRISGLSPGKHTLLTFHNVVQSPEGNTFTPIDIYVDGKQQISHLTPTVRSLTNFSSASAYLHINAVKGKEVVILFKPSPDNQASDKNVILNGFELNAPDIKKQAHNPSPFNGDEHVETNNNTQALKWTATSGVLSHDLYFGTDSAAVAAADHASPLYKGNMTYPTYMADSLYSMHTYYWRVDEIRKGKVTKGNIWYFRPAQLAFPGAEGYGRFARGGRGGKVVVVSNLNDSGPGSLRAAVENEIGPRTIVFNVSGLITLKSRLNITDPYVTIAGQTAPGKGICIRHATFGITGNDVIVRFIRVRLGKPNVSYGGMGLTGCDYSIVDHCSISWTMDEAFSSRGAKNITLQRTLISEALNVAGHHNYPPGKPHGFAASIGGDIGSFHHNLLADNYGRNWSLAGGVNGNGQYTGRMDIRNNVVYNWGTRATDGGANEVNFVNNYYKPGAGTTFFYALNAQHEGYGSGMQRYYFKGNVMPGVFKEKNEKRGRKISGEVNYATYVNSPFFPAHVTTQTADNAYKNVLSDVGCNEPVIDDHDIRMVTETLDSTFSLRGSVSGKPGFPDNQADAGGWEHYPEVHRPQNWDSDQDGLPDWWEEIHGLNLHSAKGDFSDANADKDRDGITNLDIYLAWMANPHYVSPDRGTLRIDLSKLTRGYRNNPEFSTGKVENGTLKINGHTALFTPDKKGVCSFTFTVKDAAGDSMTRQVNILSGYNVKLR